MMRLKNFIPEIEASGSLSIFILPLCLGEVKHLAPNAVSLPTRVKPDWRVDHVAVTGDGHQHQAGGDEHDADHHAVRR